MAISAIDIANKFLEKYKGFALPQGAYYNGASGAKIEDTKKYTGTVFTANGVRVELKNGKVQNIEKPLQTRVNVGNLDYPIYNIDGNYYYFDGKNVRQLTDEKQINLAKENTAINLINKNDTIVDLSKPADNSDTTNTTNKGTGGTGSTSGSNNNDPYKVLYDKAIAQLKELKNPKPIGADKAAELYGIDYNEQNILNRKNEATNEYYDNKVAEQQSLRTNFARNNANYYDQVADSYVDSYKNTAPTATGRGALAANALSTMLSAGQTNSENDYGMLQNIHNFEASRAAELANNPWLAKKEYTDIGAYLSKLSAQENATAVQKYVADLDAYSDTYSANRMYQAYQADAAASKYSGLAGAKLTKAGQTAGNITNWEQMWNYYNAAGGADYASKKTNAVLKDYVNSNSK